MAVSTSTPFSSPAATASSAASSTSGWRPKASSNRVNPRRAEYDLTDEQQVAKLYADVKPDVVLHLAAEVGGIGANRDNPGRFFFANMAMGMHLIEHARRNKLKKVRPDRDDLRLTRSSRPFRSARTNSGTDTPKRPTPRTASLKKALLVMCQAYRQQYGLDAILSAGRSTCSAPAIIFTRTVVTSSPPWCASASKPGCAVPTTSTPGGPARRAASFCTSKTAPSGLVRAMRQYDGPEPLNLGLGAGNHDQGPDRTGRPSSAASPAGSSGTRPSPTGNRGGVSTSAGPKPKWAGGRETTLEDGLRPERSPSSRRMPTVRPSGRSERRLRRQPTAHLVLPFSIAHRVALSWYWPAVYAQIFWVRHHCDGRPPKIANDIGPRRGRKVVDGTAVVGLWTQHRALRPSKAVA